MNVIKTRNSITVVKDGAPLTMDSSNPNFNKAIEAWKKGDFKILESLFDVGRAFKKFTHGSVTVEDGVVTFKGQEIHNVVVDRILEFIREGLPFEPLVKFLDKLMLNPSRRAIQELYRFLEHKNMPLTPDGDFLAYKSVKADFHSSTAGTVKPIHGTVRADGRIYNGVGEYIEVERREVDDDANVGCSHGLHVGTYGYASTFSELLLLVKVNPKDVVSVPYDCGCQKLRTAAYTVLSEAKREEGPLQKPLYTVNDGTVNPFTQEDFEEGEDYQDLNSYDEDREY
jgi:hypothetical protein